MVVVLWIVSMLAVLAAAYGHNVRLETRIALDAKEDAVARAAARAALGMVVQRYLRDALGGGDARTEKMPLNGTSWTWRFAGRDLQIRVQEAAGRVDLNRASPELLKAVFRYAGMDNDAAAAMVARVADWRDQDSLTNLNGAEDEAYRAAGRESGVKDEEIDDVAELTQLLGVAPEAVGRIRSILTIYGSEAITPRFASREVVDFLANGDLQLAERVFGGDLESLAARLPSPFYGNGGTSTFHVAVHYPIPNRGHKVYEVVIRPTGQPGRPYEMLAWSESF